MKRYKKLYIVSSILIAVVLTSVCFSYAFFANKNEQHGKLNVVVGDLKYEFESSDLVDNSILIGPGETKEITLKLTSLNSIASKYEIYYNLSNNSNVEVGYTNNPSSGIIGANEVVEINVVIKNIESREVTVTFGLEKGLKNNELVINGNSLSEINLCEYEPGQIWNFDYTGGEQKFTVPCDGNYKIELWGSGGNAIENTGGYTSGKINLLSDDIFYIYVGHQPQKCNPYTSCTGDVYNGGGAGGFFTTSLYPARVNGGGGSTDVRLVNGTWSEFNSLKSRIMVASASGSCNPDSGNCSGGGLQGYAATSSYQYGTGGLQTSGGTTSGGASNGAFGIGGNGYISDPICPNCNDGYGGGGGYYGGAGGTGGTCNCNPLHQGSGGGGSSFISGHNGCNAISESSTSSNIIHTGQPNHYSGYVFTNTVMIDGRGYNWTNVKGSYVGQPQPDGTTATGHSGNGYARITLVSVN